MGKGFRFVNLKAESGFTLLEVTIVLIIMCVILSFAMPRFQLTFENTRVDLAATGLKTIWTAERLYNTQNKTWAPDLATLSQAQLIDPYFTTQNNDPKAPFLFSIALTDSGYSASATRQNSNLWNGSISINEQGQLSGDITSSSGNAIIQPSNY